MNGTCIQLGGLDSVNCHWKDDMGMNNGGGSDSRSNSSNRDGSHGHDEVLGGLHGTLLQEYGLYRIHDHAKDYMTHTCN